MSTVSPTPTKRKSFPTPTLDAALALLNSRVVYVRELSKIAEYSPDRTRDYRIPLLSCNTFTNEAYSDLRSEGTPVAKAWMKWPQRHIVDKLVYEPGQPRFTPSGNLNTWFDSDIHPSPGDVTLFTSYMTSMFRSSPEYLDWMLAWTAYPLQNPGAKLNTAVLWWSRAQGNGKSTFGYILRRLYGYHNSAEIKEGDIAVQFNPWAASRQIIVIDEMHGRNADKKMDYIKSMVTRQTATVNDKWEKAYEVRDTLNYFFNSNNFDALRLDEHDRRFFVHDLGDTGLTQQWFQSTFRPWLETPGTLSSIKHYLMSIDLSKPIVGGDPYSSTPAPFNRGVAAPKTSSRREMVRMSKDDAGAWLDDLLNAPDHIFQGSPHLNFWALDDLHQLFVAQTRAKDTRQQFSRAAVHTLTVLSNGNPIAFGDGTRRRVYSIDPQFEQLTNDEIRAAYEAERGTRVSDSSSNPNTCVG